MSLIDSHFFAVVCACNASCEILDILPSNDLVEELRDLLHVQHDILTHMIESKHYGSDNINEFIEYTTEIVGEVDRLRGGIKWRRE